MAEVEILHRVFSNCGEDGWQNAPLPERDAEAVGPTVLKELDSVMGKMVSESDEPAWMVRRFAADEDTYACLIVSYADLLLHEGKRRGRLAHARLVRVPSAKAWLDVAPLVEKAESFPLADVRAVAPEQRLQEYLGFVSNEADVTIGEVSVAELDLPRQFLCEVLTGLLAVVGQREGTPIALPSSSAERSLIASLARAWAAVPVALQLRMAWAVGVDEGCPVDAIFAVAKGKAASGVASDLLVQLVSRYVNFLLDSGYDFTAVLRDPEMATPAKLQSALQKAEPLSLISDLAPAPAKEEAMAKKEKKDSPPPPASGGELDAALVAELDRQYQAIELSLRRYVDQCMASMEPRTETPSTTPAPMLTMPSAAPSPPAPLAEPKPRRRSLLARMFKRSPVAKPPAKPRRFWTAKRVLATINLVLFVVFVGFALWTVRYVSRQFPVDMSAIVSGLRRSAKKLIEPAAKPDAAKVKEARKTAIEKAIKKATYMTWADELKALLVSDSAIFSDAVSAVVRKENLLPDEPIRIDLEDTAAQKLDGPIGNEARARLRAYLIDDFGGTAFDGKLDDVEASKVERFMKSRSKNFKTDENVQSEVILRWLKEQYP